jgi:hypothetical protein
VDDIISGSAQEVELINWKKEAKDIFSQGNFTLCKCHSSMPSLEEHPVTHDGQTYAKESLRTTSTETKI